MKYFPLHWEEINSAEIAECAILKILSQYPNSKTTSQSFRLHFSHRRLNRKFESCRRIFDQKLTFFVPCITILTFRSSYDCFFRISSRCPKTFILVSAGLISTIKVTMKNFRKVANNLFEEAFLLLFSSKVRYTETYKLRW